MSLYRGLIVINDAENSEIEYQMIFTYLLSRIHKLDK